MKRLNDSGFTIIEFLIVFALVGIFAVGCIPNFLRARYKAKEAEVKSNIHRIQIALERYAIDNAGQYPKMIWGGDGRGWSTIEGVGCRVMWQHEPYDGTNEDTAHPPFDPLIYLGYLSSYPKNPFISMRDKISPFIMQTAPEPHKFGDGDPRFGYYGDTMGNTIEDPRYLWSRPNQLTRIKNYFLPEAGDYNIAMMRSNTPGNPFYAMGGTLESKRFSYDTDTGERFETHWPGTFFYRSAGTFILPEEFTDMDLPDSKFKTIWDFQYSRINRYILGGFGSLRTDGMDIIRLTDVQGNTVNNIMGHSGEGYYEPHPAYPRTEQTRIHFSSPELFGGGAKDRMPYFPYTNPRNGEWLYGAPDGFPDGIIIVLTSGTNCGGEW